MEKFKENFLCGKYLFFLAVASSGIALNVANIVDTRNFPIGVVFDEKGEFYSAFDFAKEELANYSLVEHGFKSELDVQVDFIPSLADSCQIADVVQKQLLHVGSLAIICALNSPRHVYSFLSHIRSLQVPFIAPRVPISLISSEVGLGIRLQPVGMQRALLDLIAHYGYNKFIYLYSGYEGLHGLQAFHDQMNAGSDSIRISVAKKFETTAEALEILEQIETSYRWVFKLIVLDCPTDLAKRVLLGHVADRSLGRRTYHYLLSGFSFDEYWTEDDLQKVSYLNVTGFRIVNPERPFVQKYLNRMAELNNNTEIKYQPILTANGAFLYDCVLVLQEGISRVFGKENESAHAQGKPQSLLPNHTPHRQTIVSAGNFNLQTIHRRKEIIREFGNIKMEGLTGGIEFSKKGVRINYSLDIMEVTIHGKVVKIGEWNDITGFRGIEIARKVEQRPYVVTSILEDPFLIRAYPEREGNEQYDGFVKELTDKLAEKLNFSYTIRITKDGKHGAQDSNAKGGWTGMVGELVTHEADLAVAALTVNADRENAIHLSKPFMFVGVSIMIYKPDQHNGGYDIFEFMKPLSRDTWGCVALAYVGVCVVLYLIAKHNQKELESVEKHGRTKLRTQFSASNSLWFTFASLVSQGTNICPKSLPCRLVGSVWWFFTLILISSYTANFAALQTVNRMVLPINSVSDLVSQKSVTYGVMEGGATEDFFKKSRVQEYQKMHTFMRTTKGAYARSYNEGIARVRREKGKYAFILESLKNEYVNRRKPCDTMRVGGNLDLHSFAVGLSKATTLKVENVSRIILELRGSGFVDDLQNKWWPLTNECEGWDDGIPKEERGRLSMGKLAGVFLVLIGGIALAFFITLFEIWWRKRSKVKQLDCNSSENPREKGKKSWFGIKFGKI